MLARMLSVALILLALPSLFAQTRQTSSQASQPMCASEPCTTPAAIAAATASPVRVHGKWQIEDFKATDASVSCSIVKYDSTVSRPILHLLCPGRDIFAPLRVHLTLTWKDVTQIPAAMRGMLVDMNKAVKFKSSKAGDSKAEITLQDPQASRSIKEWVTFTQVNVGLVLPNKTE